MQNNKFCIFLNDFFLFAIGEFCNSEIQIGITTKLANSFGRNRGVCEI